MEIFEGIVGIGALALGLGVGLLASRLVLVGLLAATFRGSVPRGPRGAFPAARLAAPRGVGTREI